jgi:glycosyltransferase involved in cell wall biosynthesis
MKIAVFTKSTTFHKGYGGFETLNKTLCETLIKRGHKIVVYSPRKELDLEIVEENGVIYKFIDCIFGDFKVLHSFSKDSWENRSVETFTSDHKEVKYDLVLGQSSWALPIIRIKNSLGIKVISILHGSKIGEYDTQLRNVKTMKDLFYSIRNLPHVLRAFFKTQREFVHGSDKLVAVSNYVKKAIVEETFVFEDKITIIHNGVDEKKFKDTPKEENIEDGEVTLVFIGRVIRAKGIFILLEALGKISNLKWKLNVIGEGDAFEELKKEVNQKNLSGKIFLKGLMGYDEVIKELEKADIFILPSMRVEGFPMTIVEAMFSGLPVIASDIGGNFDAVVDGETGYLVKPGRVEELSEKISKLINDGNERLLLGENGRKKAYKEFTIDKMVDKYESLFKEVCK